MKNYNSKLKIFTFLFIILFLEFGILNIAKTEKCIESNDKGECTNMEFKMGFSEIAVQSQETKGLVPCSGLDCKFCDLTILVENVINFALYSVAIPLVVIFIVWGGLTIMTAGDSTEKVSQGRKIIQSAIIGVFIALGAWMIINMILSAIGGGSFTPWRFGKYPICGSDSVENLYNLK